jgi:uncharacterized lipoprotein YddW (UPF0748 family)
MMYHSSVAVRLIVLGFFMGAVWLPAAPRSAEAGKAESAAATGAEATQPATRELRGIWLRPVASLTSATLQLDNIQKAGFNAIYVETFYHGFTIYPSKYVPIRPEMKGKDFLKFYVEEGHKRGLEVHAWTEVYYWEVDTTLHPQFPKTPLFEQHPDWLLRLRNGKTTEVQETAHIFANPAHPEVRRFLVDFFEEMLIHYPLDGLNLDYIRYPHGFEDAGYDDYTRKAYKELTGKDPMDIQKNPADPEWKKWVEYREDQVIRLVEETMAMKEQTRKSAVLSAAIFAGYPAARYTDTRFQNWPKMLENGCLDAIIPMVYDGNLKGIEISIRAIYDFTKKHPAVQLLPVLAIQRKNIDEYSGSTHPPMAQQAEIIKRFNLPGFSVFCYDWMMDSVEGLDLFKP